MDTFKQEDNLQPASYPRVYKSSFGRTFAFVLAGSVLVLAGLACARWFAGVQNLQILLFALPIPMLVSGLYVIVSTIRYRIVLLPDAIEVSEGFSTTVVPRNEIQSCCMEGGKLKLILQPSLKKYVAPLAIDMDMAFTEWFGSIDTFTEFAEPRPFTASVYPRVYRPGRVQMIQFGIYCLLLLSTLIEASVKHPELLNPQTPSSRVWPAAVSLSVVIFLLYLLGVRTIGYRVALTQGTVAVTTLYGTKTVQRRDIASYTFLPGGKIPDRIRLISRNPANAPDGEVADTVDKLVITLTFDRDDEFDSWIASLPCEVGGTLLPGRRIG